MDRRSFLIGGLTFPLLPRVHGENTPLVDSAFHLHPRYRAENPLDPIIQKVKPGADDFILETHHNGIAAILKQWNTALLTSRNFDAIATALSPAFLGCSLQPAGSRIIRSDPALEVEHISYAQKQTLNSNAFLNDLHAALSTFSKLFNAELQVTSIENQSPGILRTRIRYELIGSGKGFYREQRVGLWELEWEMTSGGTYRVRRWQAAGETRSRSNAEWYRDISGHSFGSTSSWSQQMLHGVDYWRAVLDGACGIDIYGHNGVSVGDIDNDGFDDVYICQSAGLPNRLYRNRGDGTFEDITEAAGVGLLDNTACALFLDIDNDGQQDLIVVRATGPLLFLNQGNCRFREMPGAFQFATPPQGTFTGAAAADYDRDGWLDVYFCLYAYYQGTGQYRYPAPYFAAENGPPNFLMRNNRDGTFRDVTAEAGLNQNNTRYSFCCAWGDPDGTGWPSLYVVNDFGRKNLYRNNGNGTFTDVAAREGIEDIGAGMSVCWFDYDNDGASDLYVSDMWTAAGERISAQESFQRDAPELIRSLYRKHAMGNSLFRNQGNGSFRQTTNLDGGGMGRWSWSSDAWDFDHDGFNDLYVTNGMLSGSSREDLNSFFWRQVVANSPNGPTPSPEYEQGWDAINELIRAGYTWSGFERNVFYANNRDGTFSNVSAAVGLDCIEDSRAFALADFDRDGRLEVVLKNRNAPQLRLLKNVRESLPPSISFRLRGVKCNRDAIGAAVTVETESGCQTRWFQAGSGFLSQHSKDLFFGLGNITGRVTASIRWPDGTIQQLRDLPINHYIWVEQGAEPSRIEPFRTSSSPSSLPSQHVESLPIQVETWLLAPVPAPDFSLPDPSARLRMLSALRGKSMFLSLQPRSTERALFRALHSACLHQNLELLIVTFDDATLPDALPVLRGSNDVAAVYNTLFRYLYDSHRDLTLPTSFLINPQGEIVKIYQGPANPQRIEEDFHSIPQSNAERLSRALPFSGNAEHYAFGRNNLSLGSVFFQRGCLDQAELFFRLAIQDDPASAEAHYGLGSVYLAQQRNTEAQASFEQSIKLRSNYPDTAPNAWNNLGLLATRQGRTDHAIVCFEEALRQNPEYWIALENLGNAYRQQKQWTAARTTLERALAMRPKDPEANYSLAMIFAQTDDTARAYEYLQKALELRPDYSEALNNLGILYLRTRRRDDAVAAFEKCIRVAPGFDQAYLNLARVYRIEGAPEKARAVLVDLLKQHPDHAQAQQALHDLH